MRLITFNEKISCEILAAYQKSIGVKNMSNSIIETIQTAQHGTERPFKCSLFNAGQFVMSDNFATHHLAWAYGENWKMTNSNYSYDIKDKREIS